MQNLLHEVNLRQDVVEGIKLDDTQLWGWERVLEIVFEEGYGLICVLIPGAWGCHRWRSSEESCINTRFRLINIRLVKHYFILFQVISYPSKLVFLSLWRCRRIDPRKKELYESLFQVLS